MTALMRAILAEGEEQPVAARRDALEALVRADGACMLELGYHVDGVPDIDAIDVC